MVKVKMKIEELYQKIIRNGDTAASFARKIGITNHSFRDMLNNKINPSPATAKKICDELNIKFDEIFTTE